MADAVVQIQGHDQRHGNNAKGSWTLNLFKCSDGQTYQTFDYQIANKALGYLGQTVLLSFDLEQRGDFSNRVLRAVDAASAAGPEVASAPVQPPPVNPTPVASPAPEDDRQLRIMRQSGLERAIMTFATAGEDPLANHDALLELSDNYIEYFVNGRVPQQVVAEPSV